MTFKPLTQLQRVLLLYIEERNRNGYYMTEWAVDRRRLKVLKKRGFIKTFKSPVGSLFSITNSGRYVLGLRVR